MNDDVKALVERIERNKMFLMGEAPIGRVWFGDKRDGKAFWWRSGVKTVLNEAQSTLTAQAEEIERLRAALDWSLNEIRCSTRYDTEQQFWSCYDIARAALKGAQEVKA